jgi:hypothetical protein
MFLKKWCLWNEWDSQIENPIISIQISPSPSIFNDSFNWDFNINVIALFPQGRADDRYFWRLKHIMTVCQNLNRERREETKTCIADALDADGKNSTIPFKKKKSNKNRVSDDSRQGL